jgi:hypothetical protein
MSSSKFTQNPKCKKAGAEVVISCIHARHQCRMSMRLRRAPRQIEKPAALLAGFCFATDLERATMQGRPDLTASSRAAGKWTR